MMPKLLGRADLQRHNRRVGLMLVASMLLLYLIAVIGIVVLN
jgi:hypothetical protein